MPITRDENFPAEIAKLVEAFGHVAEGHTMTVVLEAAAQLLTAAIHNRARMCAHNTETVMHTARTVAENIVKGVEENWNRKRKPTDIEVKLD